MRIATWNVNSLKARQEAVENWLDARRAGHPADAGDQADRRRRAGHGLRDGRLPARPPRRGALERRGHRGPERAGDRRRRHELRRRAGPRLGSGRGGRRDGQRGGLRPVRRGADARRDRRRDPDREPLRAERPGRRLAVLRRQAGLVRAAGALDPRAMPTPSGAARPGRRPQRRPDRRWTSGMPRRSTAARTSRSPSGPPSGRCSTSG